MEIKRSGSQPSAKGPAEWFTGTVRIDPLFDAPLPARAAGASVTFEPGARTAWHTHPLGQTLIVNIRLRTSAALGRPCRGDSARRCRVVYARREALAWRGADHGNDAHRGSGEGRGQGRGLAGTRQRGAVRRPIEPGEAAFLLDRIAPPREWLTCSRARKEIEVVTRFA
jgi:hypothetical protein